MSTLSHPAAVVARLEEIDEQLAAVQNEYEEAALRWFRSKRSRERSYAEAFMTAEGSVEARKAQAAMETAALGMEEEARYEALKGLLRTLEVRASIGQSILRSQGRLS